MALKKKKIAILGAGNMGEALAKGLLRAGKIPAESLTCTDARAERREEIQKKYQPEKRAAKDRLLGLARFGFQILPWAFGENITAFF